MSGTLLDRDRQAPDDLRPEKCEALRLDQHIHVSNRAHGSGSEQLVDRLEPPATIREELT